MTEEEKKRCDDNIAFVNSFFQQFSDFRGVLAIWVAKQEKDLTEKTAAISVLSSEITRLHNDAQKLMAEMIRLAKIIELERKAVLNVKPADVSLQVKPQLDKNIWDWLKELRK